MEQGEKKELKNGLARGIPIVLGYFPIGLAFGVLAAGVGLETGEATLMSILVYAGSSQLIALGLLEAQAGILPLTFTTFLVNLRHLLMSAALAPHLGHLSRLQQVVFSYEITDESFAVHITDFSRESKPPFLRIFATNLAAHAAWVTSTLLGAWAGGLLGNLEAWGIDYALPAMFIALLVFQLENRHRVAIAFFSLGMGVLLSLTVGGHWYIIITALLGASAGLAWEKFPKGR